MGDLGNFRMSLKTATATATEKEFKASCIEKGKVLFYPGSDLRKLCKTLDFALYKSDGKPDSGDEPLPDDGKGDQPVVVQATMTMKLRTRLFNQSLFTIKD